MRRIGPKPIKRKLSDSQKIVVKRLREQIARIRKQIKSITG